MSHEQWVILFICVGIIILGMWEGSPLNRLIDNRNRGHK